MIIISSSTSLSLRIEKCGYDSVLYSKKWQVEVNPKNVLFSFSFFMCVMRSTFYKFC